MRIVLIGQAAFGAKVFEALADREEEIVAVYTLPDSPKGRADPTKEAAGVLGVPVFQPRTYKDEAVLEQFRTLAPDLIVMAFVTPIIPEQFFQVPKLGAINYHPSLLPRHRGASAINWAVIMGDKKTGLTIFWPDGGIDTGPILLQKEVEIGPEDTTGSLYFNYLFPMGIDAILESVDLIREGKAPKIPQDESQATYEPICDDRVAGIDWHRPALQVYNLIRGCDPQPGAYSFWDEEKIRFYGPKLSLEPTTDSPGTVMKDDAGALRIALNGGSLTITKVRTPKGGKMIASDFIETSGIQPGARFVTR